MALVLALAGTALGTSARPDGAGTGRSDAPARGTKVVIIVGPTGSLTAGFLREAEQAARIARRHTPNVTTLFTPNATWDAVRPALQGADIVIYLGHGNGWPSKYRDSLYRPTQNGLGLNPVAGNDNHTTRYYGEKYLARDVNLAPGAIVLLHHLCYAAGNSEPGLPEGPANVARQRVDNYAAGWIAAGASAVVAEAYLAPAYYLRSLLQSKRSIEKIWHGSPTFKGNVEIWPSKRTDGATAYTDPDLRRGRWSRSLVVMGGAPPTDRSGGPRSRGDDEPADDPDEGETVAPPEADLSLPPLSGATIAPPFLTGPIVEDSSVAASLPVTLPEGAELPEQVLVEASWTPLDAQPAETEAASADALAADSEATDSSVPWTSGAGPSVAAIGDDSLETSLDTPPTSGLYELRLTLASVDTEPLSDQPELLSVTSVVHVARPLSAIIGLPGDVEVIAGVPLQLSVSVTNSGSLDWQESAASLLDERGPEPFAVIPARPAHLVGRLYRVGPDGVPDRSTDATAVSLPALVAPGGMVQFSLDLVAPERSGEYVLELDVETPTYGPLSRHGSGPVMLPIRVVPNPVTLAAPGND